MTTSDGVVLAAAATDGGTELGQADARYRSLEESAQKSEIMPKRDEKEGTKGCHAKEPSWPSGVRSRLT